MPIVLYTSKNTASRNIAEEFSRICPKGIEFVETGAESVLEVPTDFDADYLVVLSSHKSATAGRMITAHFPGNWGEAGLGGDPRRLNTAYGSKIKEFIKAVHGRGWPVFIEADHHGPTIDKPIIFVEIGSTKNEWDSREAAKIVAEGTLAMIKSRKRYESVLGIGGGHYAKRFTEFVLETEYAVGHIAPKYSIDDMDFSIFMQAIEKNIEKIKKVVLLKEETNRKQKDKINGFSEKAGIAYTEI